MKLSIKLEETPYLFKSTIVAITSKCTQVKYDFVGADVFMNKYTTNLAQLPSTLKCNQTNNLVISQTIL